MRRLVTITPLASREIEAAAFYHEGQKEGLGMQSAERVSEAVQSIKTNPEAYQVVYRGLRRVGLKQFTDWGLFFKIREDHSLVVACLSGRRDFRLLKERASGVIAFKPPEST